MTEALYQKAIEVLNNNRQQKGFTLPCQGLYPFQWLWDSGFIAIGYAHYDMDAAKRELTTLLDAQWSNGFIPHIVFHNESDTYFPGKDFHQSHLHPQSSRIPSTGMTQPPVLGFVFEELLRISADKKDILAFISSRIDQVYQFHQYLYSQRDPQNEGLAYIYHNWESGTDNSPIWDDIFNQMDSPEYTFERRDTSHVDASQRPSNREYNHYLHIIEIAKSHGYSDEMIAKHSPFLVQDPLFNAVLIKSNESLIHLYTSLGGSDDKIERLKTWQSKSVSSFNKKLWDDELSAYVHYDLRNERPLRHITSSSFTPLFAGIPDAKRAHKIASVHFDSNTGAFRKSDFELLLCASFDPHDDRYEPKRYWRGPIWINLNWLLFNGFRRYQFTDLAHQIQDDTIQLISDYGFYEYFDARKGIEGTIGLGGNNFSWTAALTIDLLHSDDNA